MGTRVHYPEEVKWKAVELKLQGESNQAIMKQLGIKNVSQVKVWKKWHDEGQTHRFSQPVGKQYSYGKEPTGLNKEDALKQENKQLKA